MARYEHLELLRLPERFERRKTGRGMGPPDRDIAAHGTRLREALDNVVAAQRRRRRPEFVDPSLILRVRMSGMLLEQDWEQLGLTVLSSDQDRTLVLFASDDELRDFRHQLEAWRGGRQPDRRAPPHNNFIAGIEEIGEVEPADRIGLRFREDGFATPDDFDDHEIYLTDIELWDLGVRRLRERKLDEVIDYIDARGGETYERYIGPSITMIRARLSGALIKTLLAIDDISSIDAPPEADIGTAEAFELGLDDLPEPAPIDDDAPLIGVIDSGVNDHPLLADAIAGAIGTPGHLGSADDFGHGTRVAGVAAFGDLRAQIDAGQLIRGARICSAKVVNEQGAFDDMRLVPSQMRQALTTLNEQLGCRIFVISLGDRKRAYDGGKVGAWAVTLDELARELDAVIVVSSGNRMPRSGNRLEQGVTDYPRYLAESTNRFFEPAGAVNVVTVGSLAHGEGIGADRADYATVRSITREFEPSPFSRVGPGVGGATKPDLTDIGGTLIFDGAVAQLLGGEQAASAGVLTLHHQFADRLFTAGSGTSYAAPRVAFSAAQILSRMPTASANLIRALLVGSAEMPAAAVAKLAPLGSEIVRNVLGHGMVDLERAAFSDDARVVLYAEDQLELDHFAVYRIPIPEPFSQGSGERTIRVTLAYDPPVRNTRADYAGVGMSFRLLRGCDPDFIFEHYRKRTQDEGDFPELPSRFDCSPSPGPREREKNTVQRATATFKRDVTAYGEDYYLVVRCESGWAQQSGQSFAVVVEIAHTAEVQLYERIRARVRA